VFPALQDTAGDRKSGRVVAHRCPAEPARVHAAAFVGTPRRAARYSAGVAQLSA
jgi:hypothetical protein